MINLEIINLQETLHEVGVESNILSEVQNWLLFVDPSLFHKRWAQITPETLS